MPQLNPLRRRSLARAVAATTLVLLAAAVAGAGRADAKIVRRLDYDTGNFRQWTAVQAVRGDARIVRKPRTEGRYAARYRVRPGDIPIGKSGERAEAFRRTGEHRGTTSWWKWSTYFPKGFRPSKGSWNVFTQWHHDGPTCTQNVSFDVNGWNRRKYLELRVVGGKFNPVTCKHSDGGVWRLGRLRRGRWLTFVFHVRWSPYHRHGFVEVWRNGHKVVHRHRVATLYRGYKVYVKQGFYRKPAGWTAVVYHDGLHRLNRKPRSLR